MEHRQFREHLADYVTGRLESATAAAIRDHVATCPDCAGEVRRLHVVQAALERAHDPAPPSGYFESLVPRFRMRLDGRTELPAGRTWRLVLPAAAMLVLAGLLSTMTINGSSNAGLRSLTKDIDPPALHDAIVRQLDEQAVTVADQEFLLTSGADQAIARGLLQDALVSSEWVQADPLQALEDLDAYEVQRILSILEQRSIL